MSVPDIAFIERLKSFATWKKDYISPISLAAAGLRFTGTHDLVQCDYCQVIIQDWHRGDCPQDEHIYRAEDCKFAISINTLSQKVRFALGKKVGYDTPDRLDIGINRSVQLHGIHSHMSSYKDRFSTFCWWPGHSAFDPNGLARAGFYFDDRYITCYMCGVKDGWTRVPAENVWLYHRKLNESCPLVLTYNFEDDGLVEAG